LPAPEYEEKWAERYASSGVFHSEPSGSRKYFVTFPFPYMDGPLHVGHAYTAARLDAFARYKRAKGFNVLFPWAWHWTGQPIAGESKRIAQGDETAIAPLRDVAHVPPTEIEKFVDPVYLATYFTREGKKDLTRYGLSVDWRREFQTTSYNPGFSSFVSWQYTTLKKMGYVQRGTNPVVWCPVDKSPVGDHDRLRGEGVSPEEMTAIKFEVLRGEFAGSYLVAVTFRPETIYGTTNLWVSPDLQYSLIKVGEETWIVGSKSVEKLQDQGWDVRAVVSFSGEKLLASLVSVPLVNREVSVLPASFIDDEFGTAIVFSVPAHAPLDYLALRDLGSKLTPIGVIELPGHGEFPAVEEVEKAGLGSQQDKRADEVTAKLYLAELKKGKMRTGPYAGLPVELARERVASELQDKGLGFTFYELPEKVVCRCGAVCHVKILNDQWFIRYSDPRLKEEAKQAIEGMAFYPASVRQAFLEVLEWVRDKPCARRSGLGTPVPWDRDWLVETLSDSTVYMAYYIISKYVNEGLLKPEFMTNDFFDYVLLGKTDLQQASLLTGLEPGILARIRSDFDYWYPVDLRVSGKDLISNHLIFFILQHAALFPRDKWPRGIAVNGFVSIEGQKMSKSKGVYVTLRDAMERKGADALRLALVNSAEGIDDPDFKWADVDSMGEKISSFLKLADHFSSPASSEEDELDRWLQASFNQLRGIVEEDMDGYRTRSALNHGFFEVWQKFRWFMKRKERKGLPSNTSSALGVFKAWVRVLELFMPFAAEEAWYRMGESGFLASQPWPKEFVVPDAAYLLARESYLSRVLEDASELLALSEKRGKHASFLVLHPASRREDLVEYLLGKIDQQGLPLEARSFVPRLQALKSRLPPVERASLEELAFSEDQLLSDALPFLSSELGVQVRLGSAGPFISAGKTYFPLPLKPLYEVEWDPGQSG